MNGISGYCENYINNINSFEYEWTYFFFFFNLTVIL